MIVTFPKKGRCVIADRDYKKGEIIEICQYIKIPDKDFDTLMKTIINDYRFGSDEGIYILLGNGSLYNHGGEHSNIQPQQERDVIGFVALRDIKKFEELTFDYGYRPNAKEIIGPIEVEILKLKDKKGNE